MLSHYRVLDLTFEEGHLAGKILGDLGADVIKIEPPGGDPLRLRGPFAGRRNLDRRPDIEASLPWLALNTSKRSLVLDLTMESDRERLRQLVATADVLLESFAPGHMAAWGLGYERLRRINAGLVYCAVSAFGQEGPRSHFAGHDLVAVAMGGNVCMTGHPDAPPVRCSMPTAYYHASPEAALGVLMALYARDTLGCGQFVDVSLHECQLSTLITGVGQYARHRRLGRRAGAMLGRTREIWRAKDGWVSFGLRGGATRIPNLVATVAYMTECGMAPEWLRDFDWSQYNHLTASDEELLRLQEAFEAFFESQCMRDLYDEALKRRILLAPCNDAKEIVAQPQLRSRELFVEREYPELGLRIEHPHFFAKSSRYSIGIRHNAPRLDDAQPSLARELEGRPAAIGTQERAPSESVTAAAPIFAGVKILELGAGAAGPVATGYFAQHGATVVRIESAKRPDFLRALHLTASNRNEPNILDKAPMFVLLNPNKQSIAINMKAPEGIALVKRLVEWADVVSENFAPGVMERWGLCYENLTQIKPDLIMASGSLFGQTGPQRTYPGFGGQGAAISGFNHLTGRPDTEAHGPYATITDSLAPRYVAVCIAAALMTRRRTGEGQYIDLSQIEAGVYSLSEMVVRYSANGEIMGRCGNQSQQAVPHGVYPCRGEDRWIAITVMDDAQWDNLVAAMESPSWASDSRFRNVSGRLAEQEQIGRELARWTAQREAYALMDELQAAGVEAGVVQNFADLLEDPQLRARGHFVAVDHPDLGEMQLERPGFRLSETPGEITSPGPKLGEHTAQVLRDQLGLSTDEISVLQARDVLT